MPTFRNRQTGETFDVPDTAAQAHATMAMYEAVDSHPCPDCDRTFDTAQGLAAHRRTHTE